MSLLFVQLLSGILLAPLGSFLSIYLNEILLYPISLVAVVVALGQGVGMMASLLGGVVSDRLGSKWVLFLGVALVTTSCLLYLFPVSALVVLLWAVASAGMSLSALSGQSYLTLAAKAMHLGVFSALYNWGYTIGGAVGAPLAALVLGKDNYPLLGTSLFVLGLITSITAYFLPKLDSHPKSKTKSLSLGYFFLLKQQSVLLLALLRFLPTCYYGLMTLLPLIIKQQSQSNTLVALYIASSSVLASFTQLLAGWTADRWGPRLPTVVSFCAILFAIMGTIISWQSVWGLYFFGALGVAAAWSLSTLLPSMVDLAIKPDAHGRVFGMLHLLWTLAMIIGTLLGGSLLELDLRIPFAVVGILNIGALLLTGPFFKLNLNQAQT